MSWPARYSEVAALAQECLEGSAPLQLQRVMMFKPIPTPISPCLMGGVTCVVFICPALPGHCHPYI